MPEDPNAATMAAPLVTEDRPVIGQRYVVLGLLGAGGMGNVYKARDLELDEVVALKVLRPELVGAPGALERFRREVKLARRVTHPNVARVFDIGEQGGEKILTMELVEGEALSALLEREGALGFARALEIASAIAAGVGAAHAAGVVHRDLKPDNVLLARDGRVVVTDFGIARAAASSANMTGGGFVGTPAYMAPEQLEENAKIDERADVYAYGALLYELCTGERAWQGQSIFSIAAARLIRPPPDPRGSRPDLPPRLAEIILRAMARQPTDRYPSMSAIVADFAGLTVPPASIPPPPMRRADAQAPAASGKTVAVLPFKNLGPADQEYVADGLTEDLIDLLSVAKGLRVRSRGVVMGIKGVEKDPREIGRDLGVEVVVEGSVRRMPGGFRIQARVVSVADGFQLWARRFEGLESELLTKNDEVARAVADALTVDLAPAPRQAPTNPEAIDLYLRARDAYHRSFSMLDHATATRLFEKGLALSKNDPLILSGFAAARAREPVLTDADVDSAKKAVTRALELAPSLPDAHVAGALLAFRTNEVRSAIAGLRRALQLAPNHAEAHETLGRILAQVLDPAALVHLETAVALEPTMDFPRISLAMWHAMHGDWERALAATRVPTDRGAVPIMPLVSRILLWRADAKGAAEVLATLTEGQRKIPMLTGIFELVANKTTLPVPTQLPPGLGHWMRYFYAELDAEIACYLGDHPRALRAIARADEDGLWDLLWFRCPLLDPLRSEPDFQAHEASVRARAERILAPA